MNAKAYTLRREHLPRFAQAMGHPTRLAMIACSAQQPCVFWGDDMHEVFPNSKTTALQHLKAVKNSKRIHDEIKASKTRRMDRKPAN